MSNPLTNFIDLTDQFGTKVSELAIELNSGVMSLLWTMGAEFVTSLVQLALVFTIFVLDLIVNQGIFLEIAGSMYQVVLDYIYQYVNPLAIAILALMILLARIYIGDKITNDKDGRVTGYEMNYETFADESFRKKVGNQLGNTAILMLVIIVAMANPFTLLSKAFELINQFVGALAPGGVGVSPQIDGILVPVLQLVNFKGQLTPACNEMWSTTLAAGGDVTKLACLTADQQDATTADVTTFLIALVSIFMVIGFVYFGWVILCRFSWMLSRMIIHIAVVPWRAALLIANPGSERQKLDTIKDHLLEAAKSLGWLLATVFIAQVVPAAVFNAMGSAATQWQLPAVVQLPLASGLLFGCGKLVNRYVGRKWKRNKDGTKEPDFDGTTGWRDFVTKGRGKTLTEAFAQANKESEAELKMSAAMISGTHTTTSAQRSAQGGSPVTGTVATDPDMDAAATTVNLTSPPSTVKLPLSPDPTVGAVASASGPVTPNAQENVALPTELTATESAAAAAASILAEDDHDAAGLDVGAGVRKTEAGGFSGDVIESNGLNAVLTAPTPVVAAAAVSGGVGRHRSEADPNNGAAVSGAVIPGAEDRATAIEAESPVDPAVMGRRMIDEYVGAVGRLAEDPAEPPTMAVTTTADVSGESRAFDRISKVYNEPVGAPGENPAGRGVTGGSGEFLSCTQRRLEWQEKKTLALILGMKAESVSDEGSEKRPDITFYSSSEDGENQVKFRGRDGFGDGI